MKWYLKASLQKFFSIIPYGNNLNYILKKHFGGLRELDIEDRVKQMHEVFDIILDRYGNISGLKVTEIGTGWVPVIPFSLSLMEARCLIFDVKRMLEKEIVVKTLNEMNKQLEILSEMSNYPLKKMSEKYKFVSEMLELDDILAALEIHYSAPVDTRHLPIRENTQDVIISRAVLQHIPPSILVDVLKELYRISKPGGISIHIVSLHDEYVDVDLNISRINFLKYPSWAWENFGNNSIKYINRFRYPYYLEAFKNTGFRVLKFLKRVDKRSLEMIPTMKISKEFKHHSNEELAAVGFTVVLEKPR